MLSSTLLLAAIHIATPPPCDPPCDALEMIEDRLDDPSELDRDQLLHRRDALIKASRAESLVVSVEVHTWQRGAAVTTASGTSWLVRLQLRPEAWWLADPAARPRRPVRARRRPRGVCWGGEK